MHLTRRSAVHHGRPNICVKVGVRTPCAGVERTLHEHSRHHGLRLQLRLQLRLHCISLYAKNRRWLSKSQLFVAENNVAQPAYLNLSVRGWGPISCIATVPGVATVRAKGAVTAVAGWPTTTYRVLGDLHNLPLAFLLPTNYPSFQPLTNHA